MQHEQYYIFKPSHNLLQALEAFDDDIAEVFREPELWVNKEGGLIRIPLDDYRTYQNIKAKLLWWMELKQTYGNTPTYQTIFGDQTISEEGFDHWWELESYQESENFLGVEEGILPERGLEIESDHPNIMEWMEHLKAGQLRFIPPEIPSRKTHNRPLRLPKSSEGEDIPQS